MRKPCVSLIIQFKEQSFHVKVDLCDEKHWKGFLCQKENEKIFQIQILVTFAATRADDEKFTMMEF